MVHVNRETWGNELAEYTSVCNDVLVLPATQTAYPFFDYNRAKYPFPDEIDFVSGVEGVGNGLAEIGNAYYPEEKKIQIPILLYCPNCEIENVKMKQNNEELVFEKSEYYDAWRKWLGEDWYMFISEKTYFEDALFEKGDLTRIESSLPPFISEEPTTIEVTINGEVVEFINQ